MKSSHPHCLLIHSLFIWCIYAPEIIPNEDKLSRFYSIEIRMSIRGGQFKYCLFSIEILVIYQYMPAGEAVHQVKILLGYP